jgi:phage anti-repressor protein
MDLENPDIRKEFITHVISMIPPEERKNISRELLDKFVCITLVDYKEKFPISSEETAKFLKVPTSLINKILEKKFIEGKDYIEENDNEDIYYLTVKCFKKICLITDSKVSEQILNYFLEMEDAYREWFGNSSYERRKYEDPEVTKQKTEIVEDYYVPSNKPSTNNNGYDKRPKMSIRQVPDEKKKPIVLKIKRKIIEEDY